MEAACVRSTFVAALTFLVTAALPADGHEIRFDPGESVLRVVAAQRVRAHQLGEVAALVRRRGPHRPHLVQHHRHAAPGELPGGLAAGKAAADDMDG